ncbi:unnamed protein product [Amoebophrya sp. A25]|nr:unnamed protein product [Amoebophrya sp. A25]|eukprot:GSA25T00016684001.1
MTMSDSSLTLSAVFVGVAVLATVVDILAERAWLRLRRMKYEGRIDFSKKAGGDRVVFSTVDLQKKENDEKHPLIATAPPASHGASITVGGAPDGAGVSCSDTPALVSQDEEVPPLMLLPNLSALCGRSILVKCEHLSVGASLKDRIAQRLVRECVRQGKRKLFEGTSGSTGVSLARLCKEHNARRRKELELKGHHHVAHDEEATQGKGLRGEHHEKDGNLLECHIFAPEDCEPGKLQLMAEYGAIVHRCKPTTFSSPEHYMQQCLRAVRQSERAQPGSTFFCDQFETELNWREHYENTGPEIWRQLMNMRGRTPGSETETEGGVLDAFVMSAGTGGTIAGCSRYFKEQTKLLRQGNKDQSQRTCGGDSFVRQQNQHKMFVVLADPQGSSLATRVREGVCFNADYEREGHRAQLVDQDTITEGFGLNRITQNFRKALPYIDDAISVSDKDAVLMCHYLRYAEGLFCGSSSGAHLAAALQVAAKLPRGSRVLTVLCDKGDRYRKKFWNKDVLRTRGLLPFNEADVEAENASSSNAPPLNENAERLADVVRQRFFPVS